MSIELVLPAQQPESIASRTSLHDSPDRSPLSVPHEVVALPLPQLVHGAQVVEHAPEGLDGAHHVDLPQVRKEIARSTAFLGPARVVTSR